MRRNDLNDFVAFVAVAEQRSFTRAAAKLGMSPSALSQAIKNLEQRLGQPLLMRTTRSVAPSDAGESLLHVLRPAFDEIDAELLRLRDGRGRPAGALRLTTFKYAAVTVLAARLPAFLQSHPGISVEVAVDTAPVDIVARRFSAGIRFGSDVDRDMVAVRVGPDVRTAVVASPAYLADHPAPASPDDLAGHACIGLRIPESGGLHPWTFERDGVRTQNRIDSRYVVDDSDLVMLAALAGQGIAYRLEDQVAEHVQAGRLVRLLDMWSSTTTGLHIYYPSRLQAQPALRALVAWLRHPSA